MPGNKANGRGGNQEVTFVDYLPEAVLLGKMVVAEQRPVSQKSAQSSPQHPPKLERQTTIMRIPLHEKHITIILKLTFPVNR